MVIPVADVEPAASPLAQLTYRDALESLLASESPTSGSSYPPILACSRGNSSLVAGIDFHPLVAALHLAYAGHRAVALSPDMIWLLICQGVGHHINANAEELRPRFVKHPGRLTLEVQVQNGDRSRKGSSDDFWRQFLRSILHQLAYHIGPARDRFVPAFSTTGPIERAAAEVVLLDATQGYFHHLLTTMICGIPAVILEGTPADWQAIVERVEAFAGLGLEWWLAPLRPILRELSSAAAGKVSRPFWRSIYRIDHPGEACSLDSALGWIGVFFPYLRSRPGNPVERNAWLPGERELEELFDPAAGARPTRPDGVLGGGFLHGGHVPSGFARVPFIWREREASGRLLTDRNREFIAGFVGVAQDPSTLRLRPEVGWAVREQDGGRRARPGATSGF